MKKNVLHKIMLTTFLLIFSLNSYTQNNSESEIPEPFRGSDETSKISINYDDLNYILGASVLDIGKSDRRLAPRITPKIGTLFKNSRNNLTAYEGNRFYFKGLLQPENKAIIKNIRKGIESVASEIAINKLNRKEQLAYWLNLYNITLIEQILDHYPKSKIGNLLHDEDDGLLNKKYLNVAGINLSLNDIHHKIVIPKFKDDLVVMYGFFQGIIGGPNIRDEAYSGASVFAQLDDNASEFINSNRGTYSPSKGVLYVSKFYEINKQLFPDLQAYLRQHLEYYLDDEYYQHMKDTKSLVASIKDNSIADLMGGHRSYGGSVSDNQAALIGSVTGGGSDNEAINWDSVASEIIAKSRTHDRYHPDVENLLKELKYKSRVRTGTVTIKQGEEKE